MCFSTTASFTAFAVLSIAGAKTLSITKRKEAQMFAAIPAVFAIQQLTEGLVWIGLLNNSMWTKTPIYYFVFFAQVLWAIWVPLSILKIEDNPLRKKIMMGCLAIGALLAIYIFVCLFVYPVSATTNHLHINYHLAFPHNDYPYLGLIYLIPIIVPPLISSIKWMKLIGFLLLSSMIFTKVYFREEVISIWCFFAAMVSLLVYMVIFNLPIKSKFSKIYQYSSPNLDYKM